MINVKTLDYGGGNIGSLVTAFKRIDINLTAATVPGDLITADLVVIPGVGSARCAMEHMTGHGWMDALQDRHSLEKPILGVCLGAQMMFDYLHEAEGPGLGWLRGEVRPFASEPLFNNGWCHLDWDSFQKTGLSRGLKARDTFYFNNQYFQPMSEGVMIVPVKELPGVPAVCMSGHLCGIQFHPEKSQHSGALVLRNLIQDHYGI